MCYLNRGLILEQAVTSLIREYFYNLHFESRYKNFHIKVSTEHPFADLYLHDGMNASDSFPCVVVSTQEDRKPFEFDELAPHLEGVGITQDDLDSILSSTENYTDRKGNLKTREIPGLCILSDESSLQAVKETIEKQGYCYGYSIRTRRKDSLGIEVWAENNQLKNEIYEQLRLFVTSNLRNLLTEKYSFYDIALFDNTIVGHRSNNYNFDFDVVLYGAHIAFDVNYCVEQIVLNTEIRKLTKNIITEALNYVKK